MNEDLSPMARLLEERRQARAAAVAKTTEQRQQEAISALHRRLRLPPGYHEADDKVYTASQGEREMIRFELIRAGVIEADAAASKDMLIRRVLQRMYDRMLGALPPVDWGGHGAKGKARDGELRKDR